RARALHRLPVRLRGHLDPDPGRDGRRRPPGGAGAGPVIPLGHYLIVSAILLSIEIMLNAVNLSFVAFGRAQGNVDGQIITFFVMTVAAAEAAVGLAI